MLVDIVFRGIFILVIAAVLIGSLTSDEIAKEENSASFWRLMAIGVGLAVFVFMVDVLTPKEKLGALAGVFFGLLVGLLLSLALVKVVDLIVDSYEINIVSEAVEAIKWVLGICICYIVIRIIMRTKDDVRFVVPYVEFAKQTKGMRPLILDTSVIIDGRIADLCQSRLFDAPLVVPRFVLNELQFIADSADKLKRNRGRRGLDILNKMQMNTVIDVEIDDTMDPEVEQVRGVDQKLIIFTKSCNGRLATTDYNLTKVAHVRDVNVVNINDLANSLKTVALPGERMQIRIIKPGEEAEQGIGYLADGTMVVVEGARDKIGRELAISVTSSLQTSAGKMIFGKFESFAQAGTKEGNRRASHRGPARGRTSHGGKD